MARKMCASRWACRACGSKSGAHRHRRGIGGAEHYQCVRRCGLEVNDLILQPLASIGCRAIEDEKDLGVCLVDIGRRHD